MEVAHLQVERVELKFLHKPFPTKLLAVTWHFVAATLPLGLAAPGSVQGLYLVVYDIEAARAELVDRGVEVSEVFHDISGIFHHAGTEGRVSGPDPKRRDYASFASFSDPDGNGWVLQEVKTRAPGR